LKKILTAALLAGGVLLAAPSVTSAQEAPPPDTQPLATLPCNIGAWLENGIRDSADVVCLQTVLRTKGIDTGPIDGWFGNWTQRAVTSFQVSANITADGEVGPETATALGLDMVAAYTGVAEDPSPEPPPAPPQRQRSSSSSGGSRSSGSSNSSSSGGGGGGGGASGVNWDRVAQCESGQNWGHGNVTNSHGTFSGGLMIMNSVWRQFGGQEFAPTAGQATRDQQIIVAERIAAQVGAARAWQCPVG
jgi:peptidoglycan hydrolase-like protein with peptidoglycan-binding domain